MWRCRRQDLGPSSDYLLRKDWLSSLIGALLYRVGLRPRRPIGLRPKSRSRTRLAPSSSKTAMRPDTKHRRILAMLLMPAGTTIAAIMTATDWQQHSVRGFLAGVVRKKLGLNLVSEQTDKGRVYRIKDGKASSTTVDRIKQAA
jgi:Protein of unknown function (DUF3489)